MKALFPYAETTRGVTVRVSVSFLPEQSEPAKGRWFWAYHIRIENDGPMAVQLMTRSWTIADGRGARHRVEGEGVVGEQPVIAPGASYDYVSGCPLTTPTGWMQGSYEMVGEDGSSFPATIPKFALTAPVTTQGRGMKRTHLPLNGLRVLDAAARHLSFTRAADELAVTPAAVGQQIRALEDTLGTVLFRRTPKGLELTPEGEAGLIELRRGFLSFEESVRAMQAGQSSKSLTIAAPRDLTAKWLLPRLEAYRATDPELRFALVASDSGLDFTEANLDLAICFAQHAGEHEGVPFGPRGFVTVGEGEIIGWPGSPEVATGALTVADAGLALDAANAGLGGAIVPAMLAAVEPTLDDPRGYWLVAPLPQWRQKKVKALVEALTVGE